MRRTSSASLGTRHRGPLRPDRSTPARPTPPPPPRRTDVSTITLDRDHLDIRFTVPERVGGLVKDQRVPVAAIRRVELVQNPIAATRGWRAPGLAVPGRRKVGHWRGRSGHELVAIRRGEPAI